MKYSPLSAPKENKFFIPLPTGGINTSQDIENIADDEAYFIKNAVIRNGILRTRHGLHTDISKIIDISKFSGAENIDIKFCDNYVYFNGQKANILLADIRYDMSVHIYSVFLAFADSSAVNIGEMFFNRLDDSTFYTPQNVTFFSGSSRTGGGIYAFVTLKNEENPIEKEYRIYEVSSKFDNWDICTDYYVPTIYINGRGNSYEEANALNQAYTGIPKTLETLNMLKGIFYAYYSSDGCSYSFRLPYSSLADETVICRIYYDTENYAQWLVYGGSSVSGEVDFMGKKVAMNVNRNTGTVSFISGGVVYPIPIMPLYSENNIRFQATKYTEQGFEDIVSCRFSAVLGDKLFLAGGNCKPKIFAADCENPLYFPECFNNDIGSGENEVRALCTVKERLLTFTDDEIYSVKLKEGAYLNKIALLSDNSTYFKDMGSFTITPLSAINGCDLSCGVKCMNNTPVWRGRDGLIYTLKSDTPQAISKEISSILATLFSGNKCFSAVTDNIFMLMSGKNAVIIELEGGKISRLFWEFPESVELRGAISDKGNTTFLIKNAEKDIYYTAVLEGDGDTVLLSETEEDNLPIETELITKSFLNDSKKHINRVKLRLKASNNTKILLGDSKACGEFDLSYLNSCANCSEKVDIITDIYGVNTVGLKIKAKGGINFGGADIYFTEIQ